MRSRTRLSLTAAALTLCIAGAVAAAQGQAQAPLPTVLDRNLAVREASPALASPISIAFLRAGDMFVLEKDSGKVQRVVGGAAPVTVLDLAVNSASERGLLGIALHPQFAANGFVYLYWTREHDRR